MPKPQPGPGQVLVKLECSILNPSDMIFIGNKNPAANISYPFTPGWEGSGTIVEVGTGMDPKLVGKRVGCMKLQEQGGYSIGGMYAEYALSDLKSFIPLSDETSFEEGCALFVNPLSAFCMVHRLKALNSKCVIITAAASALGKQLLHLCKEAGITAICTVRRQE